MTSRRPVLSSFMDKYNPEQFEIVGCGDNGAVPGSLKLPHFKRHNEPFLDGRKLYTRIFVRQLNSMKMFVASFFLPLAALDVTVPPLPFDAAALSEIR